jgi:hypothetical protein
MRSIIPAFILLSACTAEDGLGEHAEGTCGAAGYAGLVGQPVDAVETGTLAEAVRILPPGAVMTTDYRLERLNIDTDDDRVIKRLWCG